MHHHDASVTINRIKQLQALFESALESGKTFEEVQVIYLEIKALLSSLEPRSIHKPQFRRDEPSDAANRGA